MDRETTMTLVVAGLIALLWSCGWVMPHNRYLDSTMECMADSGEVSQEAFDACAMQVRNEEWES